MNLSRIWFNMRCFNFLVISAITIICVACNKIPQKKERIYNGISSQILNIVDSMQVDAEQHPFIRISFHQCDRENYIVHFLNAVLLPVPPMPPAPCRGFISEGEGFMGYKKYGNIYLVFEEYNSSGSFEKFVNKDSLLYDEAPFEEYNVLEYRHTASKSILKKYLINENDSLIFYDGKCWFYITDLSEI